MKVTQKKVVMGRPLYLNLVVFLLALGLLPVSLAANAQENEAQAETSVSQMAVGETDAERATEEDKDENPAGEAIEAGAEAAEEDNIVPIDLATEATVTTPAEEEFVETVAVETTPVVIETYVAPVDQINIAGLNIPIFRSSNTLIDAGSQVGLYGNYFLYGHNTAGVFGSLASVADGTTFTVTLDGTTKTYRVVGRDTQTKSYFEGETLRRTVSGGITVTSKVKRMTEITYYGEYNGVKYDYIIMTCAGTSYGNGDASHRMVVLANEV